ncbi:hypothetical protein D7W79_26360 [Corallococcus exercitus]|nr:hypothetical protein D7W79_26360 [Corallococcus exercitus]
MGVAASSTAATVRPARARRAGAWRRPCPSSRRRTPAVPSAPAPPGANPTSPAWTTAASVSAPRAPRWG